MPNPKHLIHTETFVGNLHSSASRVNELGWAEYLLELQSYGGNYTVAVFRMPTEMVLDIRRNNKSYREDVDHDLPIKLRG